jgi:hypothetical protein
MPLYKKSLIVLLLLLVAGLARIPLERPLGREMRAEGILQKPLDLETSEALGQTSAAIAFGGLRSLVAAVLNFSEVVPAWEEQDWIGIFTTFEQIHTLEPRVGYYWEAAAGYAADDAYSDFRDRRNVPEWQRKIRRQEFFDKGVAYLDEGIRNLPENVNLRQLKARFYSDVHKPEQLDYEEAARILDDAVTLPKASDVLRRQRLYLMARVPERRREALDLAREIYAEPAFRFPSVKSLVFTLQKEFPDATGENIPTDEIYQSKAETLRALYNYYQRRSESLPTAGVEEKISEVLTHLKLPYALDPMRNDDIKRVTLNLSRLHEAAPLELPRQPYAEESDWPLIVEMVQENGPQSPPTARVLYLVLQNLAEIPAGERVPLSALFPDKLVAARDLANFLLDTTHSYPRDGAREALTSIADEIAIPEELNPLSNPNLFPLTQEWMREVRESQIVFRN